MSGTCYLDPFSYRRAACGSPVKRKARFSKWYTDSGNEAVDERHLVTCSGCRLTRQFTVGLPSLFSGK